MRRIFHRKPLAEIAWEIMWHLAQAIAWLGIATALIAAGAAVYGQLVNWPM